jgi:hypothetical protein
MPGSILDNDYGYPLILTDRQCQSLLKLCLEDDNVASMAQDANSWHEKQIHTKSFESRLQKQSHNYDEPTKLGRNGDGLDLDQIRMHVFLTEASHLCWVPKKGLMMSPSCLDLYHMLSLNCNAPTNNDCMEHSWKCDGQEFGSSTPLLGAYFLLPMSG